MLVYHGLKADFMGSVEQGNITQKIEEAMHAHHIPVGNSQHVAFQNSMQFMYVVLNTPSIPQDSGVAIEFNVPQTSKRVDFLISGHDKEDKDSVVIIELKQWSELKCIEGTDNIVETFTGGANRRVVHPSYQAWSYARLIEDYNANVQDSSIGLYPCAYLHNYVRKEHNDPLVHPQYREYLEAAPSFTSGQVSDLRDFITRYVKRGDREKILYYIEDGKIRPSKSLQNSIASMLKGNKEFFMIDDQAVVFQKILEVSKTCQCDDKKRTIIVQGGPGTGKSVIAINLLSELTQSGQVVQYVSKNSAPRSVYLKKL